MVMLDALHAGTIFRDRERRFAAVASKLHIMIGRRVGV